MLGIRMRKPKRPPISIPDTGGHRGIALGLGNKPTTKPGNRNLIPRDEVDEFVNGGYPLFVHSSNVRMAQYFPQDQKMMVEYGEGAAYLYSGVTQHEALSFAQAQSKGTWVWDHLRVRGSRTAHKKPYVKISAGYRPPKKEDISVIDLTNEPEIDEEGRFILDLTGEEPIKD